MLEMRLILGLIGLSFIKAWNEATDGFNRQTEGDRAAK